MLTAERVERSIKVCSRVLRRIAPLGWELVAAPLVLITYPAVTGGLGWSAAFDFIPDLSMTVLVVAGLAVLTGLVRVVRLATTRRAATAGPRLDMSPGHEEPGFSSEVAAEDIGQLTTLRGTTP